jgi:hypothetical protein
MKTIDRGLEITETQVIESRPVQSESIDPNFARLLNLEKVLKEVSTAPTYIPRTKNDQIVLYKSGATIRVYFYLPIDQSWRYATLT